MRLTIDLDSRAFLESPLFPRPVTSATLKRGDKLSVVVTFVRERKVQELAPGSSGQLGIKADKKFGDELVAFSPSWEQSAAGEAASYSFILNLHTSKIDALFAATGNPAFLSLMLEIRWAEAGQDTRSSTLPLTLENCVLRDSETSPETIPDRKATAEAAIAGSDDSLWMTPLTTKQAIDASLEKIPTTHAIEDIAGLADSLGTLEGRITLTTQSVDSLWPSIESTIERATVTLYQPMVNVQEQVTQLFAQKAEVDHSHEMDSINGLLASLGEISGRLTQKAEADHSHDFNSIWGITEALWEKAPAKLNFIPNGEDLSLVSEAWLNHTVYAFTSTSPSIIVEIPEFSGSFEAYPGSLITVMQMNANSPVTIRPAEGSSVSVMAAFGATTLGRGTARVAICVGYNQWNVL